MAVTPSRTSYHHGDLRNVLLAASLELIEREGLAAVSLRRVAREAGVSASAPYHHFPDRAALLSALAVQGFEELRQRLEEAREQAGSAARALPALVEAYVMFAIEHRAHFLLMFRPELARPEKHPDLRGAGDRAYQVLVDVVDECSRAGVVRVEDPEVLTAMAWGLAHGLASLWLDGQLERPSAEGTPSPEALVDEVARTLEALLAP